MSNKHGISAIASEVICDIQREAVALITEAERSAKETLKEAKQEADKIYQTILTETNSKIEAEKRRVASVTEVEIRNNLLEAKDDLVELAFKKAQSTIVKFTESEQYHDYLLGLIELSAKKISQQNLVVKVNAKDKGWLTDNLLNSISRRIGIELKLSNESEDLIGGCKVQTTDDKIIYDSTIDSHLQELKTVFRVEVARLLFGENV